MQFTKVKVKQLRVSLDAHLESWAEENGVTAKVGRASIQASGNSFEFKVELVAEGAPTKEAEAFTQLAAGYGLSPDDLGRTFRYSGHRDGGQSFTITGLNPRASKRPILVHSPDDDREYVWPAEVVKQALEVAS